jgi:putative oxidoreductase
MDQTPRQRSGSRGTVKWSGLLSADPNAVSLDVAMIAVRIVLAWIFVYYGAGKLFGAFNGPGIHNTALFFADTAHLRPGELFAVLAGVIEFGGGIAIALGFGSRLAALALFGDQVIAMITVTWADGIGSLIKGGYEFNITLAVLALAVVALGSGRLSVDNVIGRRLRASSTGVSLAPPTAVSTGERIPRQNEPVASTKRSNEGN